MELVKGSKIFLDTAPIIYIIEENPFYAKSVSDIFVKLSDTFILVYTSVITLIFWFILQLLLW